MRLFTLGLCFLAAVSCGDSNYDDDSDSSSNDNEEAETQTDIGNYKITFLQINPGIGANQIAGSGSMSVTQNDFSIQLEFTNAPPIANHRMYIMSGGSCAAADTNGDLFVDVMEGSRAFGQLLIPLDNNLNSQEAGETNGERTDGAGGLTYARTGNYERMLEDLTANDDDTDDFTVKLPPGSNLDLTNRVLIVHGVPSTVNLPDSVASVGDLEREESIPIACGIITRSEEGPTTGDGGSGTGTTTGI